MRRVASQFSHNGKDYDVVVVPNQSHGADVAVFLRGTNQRANGVTYTVTHENATDFETVLGSSAVDALVSTAQSDIKLGVY